MAQTSRRYTAKPAPFESTHPVLSGKLRNVRGAQASPIREYIEMPHGEETKTFAGSSGEAFARKMCKYFRIGLGRSEVLTFSEGMTRMPMCLTSSVR